MRLLLACLALLFAMTAAPAAAQRYWGPDQVPHCDLALEDTCETQDLNALVTKLEVQPAEALAAEGYEGVRVFRLDAFRTLWPMTSFVSRPASGRGREGTVEARTVSGDGRLEILSRPVWESGWREMEHIFSKIDDLGEIADTPEPPPVPGQPPSIPCLDPPSHVIEIISAGRVERLRPNGCRVDARSVEALEVWDMAAAAFPTCGHFPIERYGRSLGRLRVCLMVGGENPLAAVEVIEMLKLGIGGDTRVMYEAEKLDPDVRFFSISGEAVSGRDAVYAAQRAGGLGRRWLRILRAVGDTDGVTTEGLLVSTQSNRPDPVPTSQRWRKDASGEWQIVEWRVEPHEGG